MWQIRDKDIREKPYIAGAGEGPEDDRLGGCRVKATGQQVGDVSSLVQDTIYEE